MLLLYINKVEQYGAAIYVDSLLTFATFETNFTTNFNGAIMIQNTRVTVLWNCFFNNNTSDWAGTVHVIKQNVKLIFIANCLFNNNSGEVSSTIEFIAHVDSFSTIPYDCSKFFDMVDGIIDDISTALQQKN